jgi:hypothetical protein
MSDGLLENHRRSGDAASSADVYAIEFAFDTHYSVGTSEERP